MALVLRIEVLDQYECHAGIVRQMAEQLCERLQSAEGGAHPDNGRATVFCAFEGWRRRCYRGNARTRPTLNYLL